MQEGLHQGIQSLGLGDLHQGIQGLGLGAKVAFTKGSRKPLAKEPIRPSSRFTRAWPGSQEVLHQGIQGLGQGDLHQGIQGLA